MVVLLVVGRRAAHLATWIARKVNDPVFVGNLRKTLIRLRFQIKP